MNCAGLDRLVRDAAIKGDASILSDSVIPFGVQTLRQSHFQRKAIFLGHLLDKLQDVIHSRRGHRNRWEIARFLVLFLKQSYHVAAARANARLHTQSAQHRHRFRHHPLAAASRHGDRPTTAFTRLARGERQTVYAQTPRHSPGCSAVFLIAPYRCPSLTSLPSVNLPDFLLRSVQRIP